MQRSYAPVVNTKDNPPCNTLFIGNLAEATSEDELRALFAHQPGFRQLKLVRGQRSITCFVEFGDVASAMAVHQSQQVGLPVLAISRADSVLNLALALELLLQRHVASGTPSVQTVHQGACARPI
jgi:hypothetical protein